MHKVRFAIDFGEKEPGPDGCDAVRFLMSANTGEDLKPIARIASGGELARIMLALKNVLAEEDAVGSLVFDEVDTGVSGRAAQKVARRRQPAPVHLHLSGHPVPPHAGHHPALGNRLRKMNRENRLGGSASQPVSFAFSLIFSRVTRDLPLQRSARDSLSMWV